MVVICDISGQLSIICDTSSDMSLSEITTPSRVSTIYDIEYIESFPIKSPEGTGDHVEASLAGLSTRTLSLLGMYCTSSTMKYRSSFLTSEKVCNHGRVGTLIFFFDLIHD